MKFEFDHVHLNCSDINAAVSYYIEKFGGEKLSEAEVAGTNMVIIGFGGIRLLLNDKAPSGPPAGSSVDHIGFRVADVDAAADVLKERGAEFLIEPIEIAEGVKIAFVIGPDNVMIELSQEGGRV
jgi:catechol 2,3-dioxygenase-like lactoylglutathione lyase family enzyme